MDENYQEEVARIVAAYVSKNVIAVADLPALIRTVFAALAAAAAPPAEPEAAAPTPAVPVRKSVSADYIVCLEDGKKMKMLRRYLMSAYGLTPDQYRAKWNLPADYPMVAPNYAKTRSALAKSTGLGRRKGEQP
ncbi:hypothetical protein CCP1ISM_170009 [Azospirillaceae bacterium]